MDHDCFLQVSTVVSYKDHIKRESECSLFNQSDRDEEKNSKRKKYMGCHYRQNSAIVTFVNGASNFVYGAFVFINGASVFVNGASNFV